MRLGSGILKVEQMWECLDQSIALLDDERIKDVVVMHGWNCNTELQWQEIIVKVSDLKSYIENSISTGVCDLGYSDIFIEVPVIGTEFQLGNDNDVRLNTENETIFQRVKNDWIANGYGGSEKRDEKWISITET